MDYSDETPPKKKLPPIVWAIIIIGDLAVFGFIVWWFMFRE